MPARYIRHSHRPPIDEHLESVQDDIFSTLITNAEEVQKHTTSSRRHFDLGVYTGVTGTFPKPCLWRTHTLISIPLPGTVLMNDHLSYIDIHTKHFSPSHFLSRADTQLTDLLSLSPTVLSNPRSPSHTSFLETPVGIATLVLVRALQESRRHQTSHTAFSDSWPACARLVQHATHLAIADGRHRSDAHDDGGCEVIHGRAGLLYALLLLLSELHHYRKHFAPTSTSYSPTPLDQIPIVRTIQALTSESIIVNTVSAIISRGKFGSAAYLAEISSGDSRPTGPALMWTWHGKRYLGAGHGVGTFFLPLPLLLLLLLLQRV